MNHQPHVVEGAWHDEDWCRVAAKPAKDRSEVEKAVYKAGYRAHPWGPLAYRSAPQADGRVLVFPSKEHHDAHFAAGEPVAAAVVVPAEDDEHDEHEAHHDGF